MKTIILLTTKANFHVKEMQKLVKQMIKKTILMITGDGDMRKREIYDLRCQGDWQNVTEFETMVCSNLNLRNAG